MNLLESQPDEPTFLYFAYGSCMCRQDLARTFEASVEPYFCGPAVLPSHRLRYSLYSEGRSGGVLDVVPDLAATVWGMLYQLPWRWSDRLDAREGVPVAYQRADVAVRWQGRAVDAVRTYMVRRKAETEIEPSSVYFGIAWRGAVAGGLPGDYCDALLAHRKRLRARAA